VCGGILYRTFLDESGRQEVELKGMQRVLLGYMICPSALVPLSFSLRPVEDMNLRSCTISSNSWQL